MAKFHEVWSAGNAPGAPQRRPGGKETRGKREGNALPAPGSRLRDAPGGCPAGQGRAAHSHPPSAPSSRGGRGSGAAGTGACSARHRSNRARRPPRMRHHSAPRRQARMRGHRSPRLPQSPPLPTARTRREGRRASPPNGPSPAEPRGPSMNGARRGEATANGVRGRGAPPPRYDGSCSSFWQPSGAGWP